jgi:putative RNA 2'-phosphotransferase
MDKDGFVSITKILERCKTKYPEIDKKFLIRLASIPDSRFQIIDDRIRALYGHSIPVRINLETDNDIKILYHGTTEKAAKEILLKGLKAKSRNKVHLSTTKEEALMVGIRRTNNPVILKIDTDKAIKDNIIFQKATNKIYLTDFIPPRFISKL